MNNYEYIGKYIAIEGVTPSDLDYYLDNANATFKRYTNIYCVTFYDENDDAMEVCEIYRKEEE